MNVIKCLVKDLLQGIWSILYLVLWWVIEISVIILFFKYDNGNGNIWNMVQEFPIGSGLSSILALFIGYLYEIAVMVGVAYWPVSRAYEQIGNIENNKDGVFVRLSLTVVFGIFAFFWSGAVWILGYINLLLTWLIIMMSEALFQMVGVLLNAPFEIFS